MIAEFNKAGNLPLGTHHTDWEKFSERFGTNLHRKQILSGLKHAMNNLKITGCKKVYIDGSFVTPKPLPGDFDGCWEDDEIDVKKLDPILLDTSNHRQAQKEKYSGEFFPISSQINHPSRFWMSFFQKDKKSGEDKEIVYLDL